MSNSDKRNYKLPTETCATNSVGRVLSKFSIHKLTELYKQGIDTFISSVLLVKEQGKVTVAIAVKYTPDESGGYLQAIEVSKSFVGYLLLSEHWDNLKIPEAQGVKGSYNDAVGYWIPKLNSGDFSLEDAVALDKTLYNVDGNEVKTPDDWELSPEVKARAKNIAERGLKFDQDKPMLRLVPTSLVTEVGEVLTFGAKKYKPNSWRTVPNAKERYENALLRHIYAYLEGEKIDAESGLSHLAHAGCNIAFLIELNKEKK